MSQITEYSETKYELGWQDNVKTFTRNLSFTACCVIIFLMVVSVNSYAQSADTLIQTAHQTFNSRIYLMDGQGNTLNYHEYENYRLADMTIANGELYIADAFGPVVLKVDLETGTLEQFILELPHTAYYGLAYDSTFFYVEDFGVLYRYDEQGEQQASASFGETIFGMAWDGQYLWTIMEDDDMVRCWDLSAWPELTEIEDNAIAKPSDACRGLFFDGEYFWTSEAFETIPGNSYRFDHEGNKRFTIRLHEIDSGIYLFSLTAGNKTFSGKFRVNR